MSLCEVGMGRFYTCPKKGGVDNGVNCCWLCRCLLSGKEGCLWLCRWPLAEKGGCLVFCKYILTGRFYTCPKNGEVGNGVNCCGFARWGVLNSVREGRYTAASPAALMRNKRITMRYTRATMCYTWATMRYIWALIWCTRAMMRYNGLGRCANRNATGYNADKRGVL